jgi:hypothetical protein
MLLVDTGGFHRGGFARTKPRVLLICSFVSPGFTKGRRFTVNVQGRESELSSDAQVALA